MIGTGILRDEAKRETDRQVRKRGKDRQNIDREKESYTESEAQKYERDRE